MAWFDIAAGLAQGAQQGIDRVQADQVRRKADAFKDAQEKRALAAEARTASEDRRRQLAEEFDRQDPMNINPEFVASLSDTEKRQFLLLDKANNTWKARMDPLAETKRRNETRMAEDAPAAFADMVENRARNAGTAKEKDAARISWNSGKPLGSANNVWAIGRLAGATEDEIVSRLSPKDQQAYISRTPAAIAGGFQVTIADRGERRYAAHDAVLKEIARLNNATKDPAAQREAVAINNFMRQVSTDNPDITEDEMLEQVGQRMNIWRRVLGTGNPAGAVGGSAAASGLTWDTTANAWK